MVYGTGKGNNTVRFLVICSNEQDDDFIKIPITHKQMVMFLTNGEYYALLQNSSQINFVHTKLILVICTSVFDSSPSPAQQPPACAFLLAVCAPDHCNSFGMKQEQRENLSFSQKAAFSCSNLHLVKDEENETKSVTTVTLKLFVTAAQEQACMV